MADKKPMIVIKKITVSGGGHHGGAWKVAFADFMTAMMAFFLVMWLLNQTPEVKKNVASYFSGPSMIQNTFTSYGAELTLEKLFLDLVNEPLQVVQSFMEPADFTPNLFAMGSRKIVLAEIANQLGELAGDVQVESDRIQFQIDDKYLFEPGTADPSKQFVQMMEKIKLLTTGVEDANINIESFIFTQSVIDQNPLTAKKVADQRRDLIKSNIEAGLEHKSASVLGETVVARATSISKGSRPRGFIKFQIKQKPTIEGQRKPRELETLFEKKETDTSVYDNFVKTLSNKKKN